MKTGNQDKNITETVYREIFDSSIDAIFVHDSATGDIIDVNRTMLNLYGFRDKAEVLAGGVAAVSAVDEGYTAIHAREMIRRAFESGTNVFQWRARKKDGEVFWAEVILHQVTLGGVSRIMATVRDITERKRIEDALIKSESDLRAEKQFVQMLLDTSPAYIVAMDLKGKILMMNQSVLNALGYSPDEVRGSEYMTTIVPEGERARVFRLFRDIFSGNESMVDESSIQCKNGNTILVEWYGKVVKRTDYGQDLFVAVGTDISARKKAELELRTRNDELSAMYEEMEAANEELVAVNEEMEAANEELIAVNHELQVAEERYRGVVETQSEMIARFRNDGVLTFVNNAWKKYYNEHLGYDMNAAGKNIVDLMQLKNWPQILAYLESLKPGELTSNMERSITARDGTIRWQLWYLQKIYDDTKNITEYQVVGNDITERRLAADALAAEKEQLSVTLRSIGDGVITTDIGGRIVIMNKVAEELTGWTQAEAAGLPLDRVFTIIDELSRAACENPVKKILETGQTVELEHHTLLVSRDGTERIVADSCAPIRDKNSIMTGAVLVFRDMTEKRKFIDAIQQTDKLTSLGVLAGGIAHDFNNLLGGIFGYIEMARLKAGPDKNVAAYLDKAMTVYNRARDLTQQLLTFSKGGTPVKRTGDIGLLLRESSSFALSGSDITCSYNIDEELAPCDFDENQMGQVIDNIVINAKQAMPLGGSITITAANCDLHQGENPVLQPGRYIKISISDTGIGIPPELIKRIFDPFFTTKQQGNGLGLATCYSIVQKHDGYIEAESVQGKGTLFRILIPASGNADGERQYCEQSGHRGSGIVLVMDDEDFIREIACDMLSSMGYTVLSARDGDGALKLWSEAERNGGSITAAFFDLTIPGGMGGKNLIREIRELHPHTPVFASSGFSEDHVMSHPGDYGFTASIRKPYRFDELCSLMNMYLGSGLDFA